LLTKSLTAPPKEHFGLADTETRYRQRYIDLAVNVDSFERFAIRSAVVSTLRGVLVEHDFMEVETPLLHAIAGGATARPFITHHNSLGIDLYLRIAPELYLKRLLVGGYERVFEIGRSFRNEGLSPRHNPEFTMLEAYWAYARGDDWMDLMERTIERLAREHGAMGRRRGDEGMPSHEVHYEELVLDMSAPFKRARYADLVAEHAGVDIFDAAAVEQAAAARGIETAGRGTARIADDLFGECVESHLTQPTFVTHFPIELSPLAKASPEDPRVAERFELYMAGLEVANGFSELNDPDEQLRRFEEQVAAKDPELPGQVDYDYVEALRYGLPPAAGIGVGIDRLVMLLTDTPTIRDVILFPLLRPLERD
jgi:lysyl-tRNA synthetase class 2